MDKLGLVKEAIWALKDPNGSSMSAILKWIKCEKQLYKFTRSDLKPLLDKGIQDGTLDSAKNKNSYKLSMEETTYFAAEEAAHQYLIGLCGDYKKFAREAPTLLQKHPNLSKQKYDCTTPADRGRQTGNFHGRRSLYYCIVGGSSLDQVRQVYDLFPEALSEAYVCKIPQMLPFFTPYTACILHDACILGTSEGVMEFVLKKYPKSADKCCCCSGFLPIRLYLQSQGSQASLSTVQTLVHSSGSRVMTFEWIHDAFQASCSREVQAFLVKQILGKGFGESNWRPPDMDNELFKEILCGVVLPSLQEFSLDLPTLEAQPIVRSLGQNQSIMNLTMSLKAFPFDAEMHEQKIREVEDEDDIRYYADMAVEPREQGKQHLQMIRQVLEDNRFVKKLTLSAVSADFDERFFHRDGLLELLVDVQDKLSNTLDSLRLRSCRLESSGHLSDLLLRGSLPRSVIFESLSVQGAWEQLPLPAHPINPPLRSNSLQELTFERFYLNQAAVEGLWGLIECLPNLQVLHFGPEHKYWDMTDTIVSLLGRGVIREMHLNQHIEVDLSRLCEGLQTNASLERLGAGPRYVPWPNKASLQLLEDVFATHNNTCLTHFFVKSMSLLTIHYLVLNRFDHHQTRRDPALPLSHFAAILCRVANADMEESMEGYLEYMEESDIPLGRFNMYYHLLRDSSIIGTWSMAGALA